MRAQRRERWPCPQVESHQGSRILSFGEDLVAARWVLRPGGISKMAKAALGGHKLFCPRLCHWRSLGFITDHYRTSRRFASALPAKTSANAGTAPMNALAEIMRAKCRYWTRGVVERRASAHKQQRRLSGAVMATEGEDQPAPSPTHLHTKWPRANPGATCRASGMVSTRRCGLQRSSITRTYGGALNYPEHFQ